MLAPRFVCLGCLLYDATSRFLFFFIGALRLRRASETVVARTVVFYSVEVVIHVDGPDGVGIDSADVPVHAPLLSLLTEAARRSRRVSFAPVVPRFFHFDGRDYKVLN